MNDFKTFLGKVTTANNGDIRNLRENLTIAYGLDIKEGHFDLLTFYDKKALAFEKTDFAFSLFDLLSFQQSLLFQNPKGIVSLIENQHSVETEIERGYLWLKSNPSGFVHHRLVSNKGNDLPLKGFYSFYYFARNISNIPLEEEDFANIHKTLFK